MARTTASDPDIELWQAYARQRTIAVRNQLVELFLPLVERQLNSIATKLPSWVDLDALRSAGGIGLIQAVESFDMGREIKFSTYAPLRIRGAMLDELRNTDVCGRLKRQREKRIEATAAQLTRELCRPPTADELCDRLGITLAELAAILRDTRPTASLPIRRTYKKKNRLRKSA
jgi:RNA polymerase sigma factor FliA